MTEENPTPQPVQIDPKQERTFAMLCHLAALSGVIIPFGNVIGPLVVWLLKKDEFPQVDVQGKEALNFQISMAIYSVIAFVLCFVMIGFLLVPAVVITNLVLIIIASVKTNNGEPFEYPLKITFLK